MWLSIQSFFQLILFCIIFIGLMTCSLLLFFILKEKLINRSNDEELKKANQEFNRIIDSYRRKFKR